MIATATTDAVGFYYFAGTDRLTVGGNYTVTVTPPKGYKTSTPKWQLIQWKGTAVTLPNFVLN